VEAVRKILYNSRNNDQQDRADVSFQQLCRQQTTDIEQIYSMSVTANPNGTACGCATVRQFNDIGRCESYLAADRRRGGGLFNRRISGGVANTGNLSSKKRLHRCHDIISAVERTVTSDGETEDLRHAAF